MHAPDQDHFTGLLDDLAAAVGGAEHIRFGDILATIGARGFGPLLCLFSTALILPSGMIPGLPGIVAVLYAMIGIEIALGNRALRLPRRVRDWQVPATHVRAFIERAVPLAKRARRVLKPRYADAVTARPTLLLVAATLLATAVVLFVMGFIPGLPFLIAVPVLLVGLGLTAEDGLVLGAGLILLLMPLGAVISWIFRPGPAIPDDPAVLEQMLEVQLLLWRAAAG